MAAQKSRNPHARIRAENLRLLRECGGPRSKELAPRAAGGGLAGKKAHEYTRTRSTLDTRTANSRNHAHPSNSLPLFTEAQPKTAARSTAQRSDLPTPVREPQKPHRRSSNEPPSSFSKVTLRADVTAGVGHAGERTGIAIPTFPQAGLKSAKALRSKDLMSSSGRCSSNRGSAGLTGVGSRAVTAGSTGAAITESFRISVVAKRALAIRGHDEVLERVSHGHIGSDLLRQNLAQERQERGRTVRGLLF